MCFVSGLPSIGVLIAPGQAPDDFVNTLAHEGMHCNVGFAFGDAHQAIFEGAADIMQQYRKDPDGNNCDKCKGGHPGDNHPTKPPPVFNNWGGY